MPFLSTAADYIGRTIDLLAFYGAQATGDTLLTQALALDGQGGAVVAGVEKLAQRFLFELLTEQGSLQYLPARGCRFLTDARRGAWRTAVDVNQSFYSALIDVRRNLIGEDRATDPADERYGSADLLGVTLAGDGAALSVAITSAAGTGVTILTPLTLTI